MTIITDTLRASPLRHLIQDRGLRINTDAISPRGFSFKDFPEYDQGYFRNVVSLMRKEKLVYMVIPGKPTFYAVSGSGLRKGMTVLPTVGGRQARHLQELLLSLRGAVVCVHDVRLTFSADRFYDSLDLTPKPRSGDKLVGLFSYEKHRSVRVIAHRTGTVTVIVGCSENPFPRDNLTDLLLILEHVKDRLQFNYTQLSVRLPLFSDWTVVQWHYNKDGGELSGTDFQVTVSDFSQTLYRLYSKEFVDGKKLRLERIETPNKTIQEIAKDTLDSS